MHFTGSIPAQADSSPHSGFAGVICSQRGFLYELALAVKQAAAVWGFAGCLLQQQGLREFRDFFDAVLFDNVNVRISST